MLKINDESIIRVEDLYKTYQNGDVAVHALNEINFEIKRGEFVAIMGASGSGKSTLMNILGCLDTPTDGHYYLEGIDIREKTDNELCEIRNRKIGFVFQSFNLIPRTSALKNVELPMIYAKIKSHERKKRALELLDKVGLKERKDHKPNEMSGGQRQRVAIARALSNKPPIILADEPTGNLDSKSSIEIMQIFTQLNDEGNTVIMVTHEPDIAEYTKRILTFKDGRMISDRINLNPKKGGEKTC